MLVLSRYQSQSIVIDGDITITVLACDRGQIRIGIDAPKNVNIVRTELLDQLDKHSYLQRNGEKSTDPAL